MRNFALYSLVLASVSMAPVFEAQRVLGMPVLHPVSLAGPALLLLFSLLGAALLTRMGARARCCIFAFIVVVHVDILFGGHALLGALVDSIDFLPRVLRSAIKIILISGLFSLAFLALWRLRKNAAPVLATTLAATLVSGLVLQVVSPLANELDQPEGWPRQNREPIRRSEGALSTVSAPFIHIVLDAMMAPEAIDFELPGGADAHREVMEFHERFRFRLYGRAFSRWRLTFESIPDLLNYNFVGTAHDEDLSNTHFLEMAERGYDVVVYQSSVVDHCAANAVTKCNTFYSHSPTQEYYSPFSVVNFENQYVLFHIQTIISTMKDSYVRQLMIGRLPVRYDVPGFPRWFDKFSEDIIANPEGKYIFAHFLVPHSPFILTIDCDTPLERIVDGLFVRQLILLPELNKIDDETILQPRARNYQRYFEQVSCTYSKLTVLLEMMVESGRFETATIVIHGDHGSRIATATAIDKMTERDIVDNYSTIFSIRSPGVQPGYDRRFVSIQQLFAEFFAPQPVEPTTRHTVVGTSSQTGDMVEVDMPEFGLTRPTNSLPQQPQ